MNEKNDNELISEILNGKTEIYKEVILRYQKPVFNLVIRMVRNYDEAKDITQNIFIKAYYNLSTFNFDHKFFSWLYRIGVNESLNFINNRKQYDEYYEENYRTDKSPADIIEKNEESIKIHNAIEMLKEEYRTLIILKHFQELSYEEIADVVSIPVKKVKSRLFTARNLLKEIIIRKGEFENE